MRKSQNLTFLARSAVQLAIAITELNNSLFYNKGKAQKYFPRKSTKVHLALHFWTKASPIPNPNIQISRRPTLTIHSLKSCISTAFAIRSYAFYIIPIHFYSAF